MQSVILQDDLKKMIAEAIEASVNNLPTQAPTQPTASNKDELLSKQTVADELHVSLQTISNYFRKGRLPFLRVDRRVYVRRSDLNKVLEAGGGR